MVFGQRNFRKNVIEIKRKQAQKQDMTDPRKCPNDKMQEQPILLNLKIILLFVMMIKFRKHLKS